MGSFWPDSTLNLRPEPHVEFSFAHAVELQSVTSIRIERRAIDDITDVQSTRTFELPLDPFTEQLPIPLGGQVFEAQMRLS